MSDKRLQDRIAALKSAYRDGRLDGLTVSERSRERIWHAIRSNPGRRSSLSTRNSRNSFFSRNGWWLGAGALTAALLVVAMFSRGQQQRPTVLANRHHHVQPAPKTAVQTFEHIDMLSASTGWALTQKNSVLYTSNGGATWSVVTPPGMPKNAGTSMVSLASTDAQHAWVAVASDSNAPTIVFYTDDGGQRWQSVTTDPAGEPQIRFLNDSTGFLLLFEQGAMQVQGVILLRTTDGGAHWNVVADGRPSVQPLPLISAGGKNGFGFADSQNVWLTGTWIIKSFVLYATHDGGSTWNQQVLALPQGFAPLGSAVESRPPVFSNASLGLLPVVQLNAPQPSTVFYRTTDGGRSWTPGEPVPGTVYSMVNADEAFVTDGKSIYGTTDGGAHWTKVRPNISLQGASQLRFVNLSDGWAIANGRLLRTTDGGRTWTK